MPIRQVGTTSGAIAGYDAQRSVSSSTNANQNEIVLVDASGGNVTITLPSPSGDEFVIVVKRTDTSSNQVTLATPGSATIDNDSNRTLDTGLISRTVTSDGTNYHII